ncbi:hypothetical protein CDEST_13744 [Colletotrichum destructivum]|uniref:Uncharacterized protein n=1 Tax=Colletotrichum destructivum TaxID=34406 RepID=A0AAX4IZY4_9PEZI|nr:hypothetical protein CDEST_13744 [Colletotrichum destructivum]
MDNDGQRHVTMERIHEMIFTTFNDIHFYKGSKRRRLDPRRRGIPRSCVASSTDELSDWPITEHSLIPHRTISYQLNSRLLHLCVKPPVQSGSVCQEAGTVPATPALIGKKAGHGESITQPPSNCKLPAPASQNHKTRHLEQQNGATSPGEGTTLLTFTAFCKKEKFANRPNGVCDGACLGCGSLWDAEECCLSRPTSGGCKGSTSKEGGANPLVGLGGYPEEPA